MKYRVYLKKERTDLLEKNNVSFYPGYILGESGKELNKRDNPGNEKTVGSYEWGKTQGLINEGYIPIDNNKRYQLKELGISSYKYYIHEYKKGSGSGYIHVGSTSITFDITENNYFTYYSPRSNEVDHIRIQVSRNFRDKDYYKDRARGFMFLESEDAILIHDSGSPEKSDHLLDAILNLSDSASGDFSFIIHKDHHYYKNKVNLWTDTIYVTRTYKDKSERIIWDGRPISYDYEDGLYYYKCEGALGYLNDVRVINNGGYDIETTVSDFVTEYIIDYKNESIYYDKMDRTFFNIKENGIPKVKSDIEIDPGVKNIWSLRYDSGMKWLNDIVDGYNGRMKVVYRKEDSPNDEIICRRLVMIQDFDKKNKTISLPNAQSSYYNTEGHSIKFNDIIYILGHSSSGQEGRHVSLSIYKIIVSKLPDNKRDTIKDSKYSELLYYNADYDLSYSREEYLQLSNYSINNKLISVNDLRFEDQPSIGGNSKAYNALSIYVPTGYGRFPRVHTTLGVDVFDVKGHFETEDVVTKIIPRGAPCSTSIDTPSFNTDGKSLTDSTYIYLTTTGAFVEGNWSAKIGSNTIQGYREFKATEKPQWQSNSIEDPVLIKKYGLVEAVVDFESANTPKELFDMAKEWLNQIKKDMVKKNIEVSLSDIGQIEIPKDVEEKYLLADPEYIDVWTQIYVKIPELDIGVRDPEEHFYVSEMSIPLDNHYNSTITLSNISNKVSKTYISAGDIKGVSKGVIDKS